MNILNIESGFRDNVGIENTIKDASTKVTANLTFQDYVNFLTEGVIKKNRIEILKNSALDKYMGQEEI